MPDLTPDQAIDQLKKLPEDKQRLVLGKLSPDVRKGILSKLSGPPDFTSNPKGEGTYSMADKAGKSIKVPYSTINDASKAGLTMDKADIQRYVKDAASDPLLKKLSPSPGVKVTGKNSAGQPIVGPDEDEKNTLKSFSDAEWNTLAGAAKGAVDFLNPNPSAEEVSSGYTRPVDTLLRYPERLVRPNLEMANQTDKDVQAGNYTQAAGHGMAAVIPVAGPWAASIGQDVGEKAGQGDYTGAAGSVVGNAVLSEAPKVIKEAAGKVIGLAPKVARAALESATDTTPRQLKELAEKTHKENTEATQKHLAEASGAVHETIGKEIEHQHAERNANEEAQAKHLDEVKRVRAKNQEVKESHQRELDEAQRHNQNLIADHNRDTQRTLQENKAAEHLLEMRRSEEAGLKADTDAYYAKEDAVKAKAKGKENAAWQPWREKVKDVKVDGGEIEGPLKKIIEISPEVRRALRQLTPDPGDAAPESLYAQDRAAIMKSQGISGTYWELPPERRTIVDQIAQSSGFQPEPVDFNPETGTGIPVEQIHRVKSIIRNNIYNNRYEGPLLGEMKQLGNVLEQAEARASTNAGALDDLNSAKKATTEYQKAFGKERPSLKTVDRERMKDANPEEFQEREDQARLEAAKVHDPSLAEDYQRVKDRRERLKKMKSEDELRKSIKQLPEHPTNFKQVPPSPTLTYRDSIGKLYKFEGGQWVPAEDTGVRHQLTLEPQRPEPVQLPRPNRSEVPDKPEEKTADLKGERGKNIQKFADQLRAMGVRRALYTGALGLPAAITTILFGHPVAAVAGDAIGAASVFGGSHLLADLLEKPEVSAWISRVTPGDVEQWKKLPPEQKAVFAQDMGELLRAAKQKKLKVSPALSEFIDSVRPAVSPAVAGAASNLHELKAEAARRNPNAIKVTAPDGSVHVFPDQASADRFKQEAGIN